LRNGPNFEQVVLTNTFIAPPPLSPPSAHTNRKPAGQSAHQQSLSAARKSLYLAPFSPRGISSGVRACYPPKPTGLSCWAFSMGSRNLGVD